MRTKQYTLTVSAQQTNDFQVENLLQQVCDSMNAKNHFGIFSVAVEEAISLAQAQNHNATTTVTLKFAPCKGGIQMEISSNAPIFKQKQKGESLENEKTTKEYHFLINKLAGQVDFEADGKRLTANFFIMGIDPVHLLERSVMFRTYFHAKHTVEVG